MDHDEILVGPDGSPQTPSPHVSGAGDGSADPVIKGWRALPYRLRWTENLPRRVRSELVHLQTDEGGWPLAVAGVLAAVIIVISRWDTGYGSSMALWGLAAFSAALLMAAMTMFHQSSSQRENEPDGWAIGLVSASTLLGCIWGAGGWIVFDYVGGTSSHTLSEALFRVFPFLLGLSALSIVVVAAQVGLFAAPFGFLVCAWGGVAAASLHLGGPYRHILAVVPIVLAFLALALCRQIQARSIRRMLQEQQNRELLGRLSRREEHFRTLIDNLSDLIIVVDEEGLVTFHSPSAERLLGVGRGGLVGRTISGVIHPDDTELMRYDLASLREDPQQITSRDIRMRHVGGHWRAVHMQGRAFVMASGRKAVILSAQDATEQMKVRETLRLAKEHAEAMGRAKTDFLAVMSHEIRTPMSGIIGLIDLLKNTGLSEKQREYVGALDRAGEHLSDLLNDILDFSKIEANKLESEKVVFDLRKVITGIMDIFRARAEAKGVRLQARIADDLPRLWTGDVRHLRQVLANLLGNAVKFTEAGFVEVRINHDGKTSDGRAQLKIAVEDTGIGIEADQLQHVFEPFAQADASPSRRHGGTGLGLAISRRLVELMEGRIWAISRAGRGSTFFVLLPLEVGDTLSNPNARALEPRKGGDGAYFANSRILVVDDSDLNRLVIGDMLQGLGLTVETATNGAEAVEQFDGGKYDLVFLDIQMPIMDGFEAAEAMRECEEFSNLSRCPIIALSATALKDDRDRALEAGCDRYLVKPLRKETLVALLKTYLVEVEATSQTAIRASAQTGASILEPELVPLLPSFFMHLEDELAQLERAVKGKDAALIYRLAHQSKGNAMLFGFNDLVEVLRGLETHARALRDGESVVSETSMEQWFANIQAQADALRQVFAEVI